MVISGSSRELHGRVLNVRQAWLAQDREVMLIGMKNDERTNIFLSVWNCRGAELAVKIEEPLIKTAGGDPGYSWEDDFVAAEDDWQKSGMIAPSVHLVKHSFP